MVVLVATGRRNDAAPHEQSVSAPERPFGVGERRVDCAVLHRPLERPRAGPHFVLQHRRFTARKLSVSVVSSIGKIWSGTLKLAAHSSQALVPGTLDKPPLRPKAKIPYVVTYGVGVEISGGGVVAEEIAAGRTRRSALCVGGYQALVRDGLRHSGWGRAPP